jgi:tRNA-2-methylthio-N6-dimethylallyladenosine synthase
MRLIREVNYAAAFSFKYSIRPGTPGAGMDGQVDEAVKTERLARLQALINEQTRDFGRECVGKMAICFWRSPGATLASLLAVLPGFSR